MPRFFRRVSKKAGLVPGTLIYTNDRKMEEAKITIIDYDEGNIRERQVQQVEECLPFKESPTVTWINVDGLHDIEIIEKLGTYFDLHPLILEDILNTNQRPKFEDFEHFIYVVLKMLSYDTEKQEIIAEQVSIVIGENFVLSFQEREGDVFNPVRERIRNAKGRIRKMGADYLAYALLDAVVDNYFVILEALGEEVEELEEVLVVNPTPQILHAIHHLKRETIFLRKAVWPLREVIDSLGRRESPLIGKGTTLFLRDVYDHTIQIIDTAETFRDLIAGMLDIYLSSISNRMNNVMKVLTIIATIFIPLTFIAGIYGMNFKYMPELDWRWSYPLVWVVMVLVAVYMVMYFKDKGWL
ncbi:MAG: magnesium/cobalt transporter CorA [bacterium]